MQNVSFPFSLQNVKDLLHEHGIDVCYKNIRLWWNRFGLMFAAWFRKKRAEHLHFSPKRRWYLDKVFVKIRGERHYLWRAADHEGEVLESFVTKMRDRKYTFIFLEKTMKRYGRIAVFVTYKLPSYGAALKDSGSAERQETGSWLNNRVENLHLPFRRRELAMLRFRRMQNLKKGAVPGNHLRCI